MKKISILSFANTKNYGGLLQAYALQFILSKEGFYVEHIDYSDFKPNQPNFIKRTISHIYRCTLQKMVFDRLRLKNQNHLKKLMLFSNHINNSIDLSNYDTDVLIVGSDQVWNPFLVNFDSSYLLSFNTKATKMSYSASFGLLNKTVPQKWLDALNESLKGYKYVSLREACSSTLIKTESHVDLDPTLLLTNEEWRSVLLKHTDFNLIPKEDFVLCYLMPGDTKLTKAMLKEALLFSKARKKKLVVIGERDIKRLSPKRYYLFGCGPFEFLTLILNSYAVFTNSYHGTILSFKFKKEFYSFINDTSESNILASRIIDFAERFNLNGNLVVLSAYKDYNYKVNSDGQFTKLEKERKESISRLINHL